MGGTLTAFPPLWFFLSGESVVNISAHCWVLREHASVFSWETKRRDLVVTQTASPVRVVGVVVAVIRVLCVV
jgi:hypothetical protein